MKKLLLAGVILALNAVPVSAAPNVQELLRQAPGLSSNVLKLALEASSNAAAKGLVTRPGLLTVIDYSIPSSQPRLFVLDLDRNKVLYRELVAHGRNSGDDRTTSFSNDEGSLETSLGLFATAGTYEGRNGYSLRLRGLEAGVNDNAMERAIVMHGAPYVSQSTVAALGRLGRSWGCPAVRPAIAKELINTIRGGSAVFSYYPDQKWLTASAFLTPTAVGGAVTVAAAR
jgi:hypothetical protein